MSMLNGRGAERKPPLIIPKNRLKGENKRMKLSNILIGFGMTTLLLVGCSDDSTKKENVYIEEDSSKVEVEAFEVENPKEAFQVDNLGIAVEKFYEENSTVYAEVLIKNESKKDVVFTPYNFELGVGFANVEIKGEKIEKELVQTPVSLPNYEFTEETIKPGEEKLIKLAFFAHFPTVEVLKIKIMNEDDTDVIKDVRISVKEFKK